jgi:predicted nucleic-acid-binding protein
MSKRIILDTSALIRFFTLDDEKKAKKVRAVLESNNELVLIESVTLELVFTLLKVYKLPKTDIVEVLQFLISRPNVVLSPELQAAVELYKNNNLSITDCLVIAYAEGAHVASFDEQLLKHPKIRSAWSGVKKT